MKKQFILFLWLMPALLTAQEDTLQLYEPAMIRADIDTLIAKLMEYHPTFPTYYRENDIRKKVDSIKETIQDPTSSLELFRIMQPLISIDGHTSLHYRGDIYPKLDAPLFPFRVVIHDKKLYVKEDLSENKVLAKGEIIDSVNGVPASSIIRKLSGYLPGEKEAYKIQSLAPVFHIYYLLVYGSFPAFTISTKGSNYSVGGASWQSFDTPPKPKYELRYYDDDIAYLYKRKFHPDFLPFMDSVFTEIAEKNIRYLIIDNLRGGGMTDVVDTLMSYITDVPYTVVDKKYMRISSLTTEFVSDTSDGRVEGEYFVRKFSLHQSDRTNRFSGDTYILTGIQSYSSATCFSAAASCYGAATIVGQESGQPLVSNGDLDKFVLPHTGLICLTCLSTYYMPCYTYGPTRGVMPDYEVIPSTDDLLNDWDYLLDYTLKIIRENRTKE